ncbi:LysR family transcriptional regulator [Marinomonas aquiplantarum]|uniref:DNA-binding transcriptional LysR family regulator n=1 Tax=Marinomonas aquiplantarum TaxID=491951 RepID=A0A366D819_9GAMM|nr:LysR family transcriptional regulator [Marinomonas aquiplantarum]RBO86136.1 DNA-binding transcriptional LysR family regulator [Marinomonas aquiplantarum]
MKIDQIKAFIAVVETGSFRSAAEAIHKTQPSVSAAIKALESQYDITLFDRNSYRPGLTPEGHAFFRQCKKLMSQVTQLDSLGHDLAKGVETPPLHLCLSQMSLDQNCVERIQAFQQQYSDVDIDITTDHLYGLQDKLAKGKCDITIGPRYGLDDRHSLLELYKMEMITVMSSNLLEQLNLTAKKVKQTALQSVPQILVINTASDGSSHGHRHVLTTGKRWYVNDFQAKKSLLLNSMGWARMPKHMILSELENEQLVPIEVDNFMSRNHVPIYMVRLRQQTHSYQVNLFWEMMRSFTSR